MGTGELVGSNLDVNSEVASALLRGSSIEAMSARTQGLPAEFFEVQRLLPPSSRHSGGPEVLIDIVAHYIISFSGAVRLIVAFHTNFWCQNLMGRAMGWGGGEVSNFSRYSYLHWVRAPFANYLDRGSYTL